VANRSISISLEEGLLAELDALGANRSSLVSEALTDWLARRRIAALNSAYAHLASKEDAELATAADAAVAMGLETMGLEAMGLEARAVDRDG
jgi:metal-responsive CopG/Arc/MetJ family transcriptional regulator